MHLFCLFTVLLGLIHIDYDIAFKTSWKFPSTFRGRPGFPLKRTAVHRELNEEYEYDPQKIRNFCIIAHIDHGKSTLADRLLQITKTVLDKDMQDQLLDNMDIERERGITIKLQTARMNYRAADGQIYLLNLIDTPGHVDFGYEVSRSLAACEGALLVVDSTQGVQAQTIANVFLALENNLEIIPVINKIDLSTSQPEKSISEIESTIGLDCSGAIHCSAKTGLGVPDILENIIHFLPPPKGRIENPLQALIFDSYYDSYRGVVVLIRVMNGEIKKNDKIYFMNSQKEYEVLELGIMKPNMKIPVDSLKAGEVGYVAANIKAIADARVGDTITLVKSIDQVSALPGYEPAKQMVFASIYPSDSDSYEDLRDAINKLKLNDASLYFQPETSPAMGFGFRCGFLGLLHMDIVQERLEREYDLDLIITAPSVVYRVITLKGTEVFVQTPSMLPDPVSIKEIQEPYVKLEIIAPSDYIGPLMTLAQDRRGEFVDMKFLTPNRTSLIYEIPLAEVIVDFFDDLKSRSKGYASMSFQEIGYRTNDLIKLDFKINGEEASPLAMILPIQKAQEMGRKICEKLKELIPRQQFRVPIQAVIGTKVIASEQISAVRKDVLAKCYGGDISRKKKLLNKQAEGKKRMKEIGKVNVPQEAFLAVLNLKKEKSGGD